MSSPSKQRRVQNRQVEDRISDLPDEVLCYILSYIPTKSAVKTSILSKRWKYVWHKVPALDFTEMPLSVPFLSCLTQLQMKIFKSFVDKVLLHNDISYLQCVCLDVNCDDGDSCYKSWLSNVARREGHKISINFEFVFLSPEPVLLPTQLFSGERLVVLQLCGPFSVNGSISLHLPNIEKIYLDDFRVPNDEFMKRLLSSCPVLKELRILRCWCISKLHVESPTLKNVEIREVLDSSFSPAGGIAIKAPSLKFLALQVQVAKYDIGDLSSVVEADLDFSEGDFKSAFEVMTKLSGVKTLCLITYECTKFKESKPPILQNLTCLKIYASEYTLVLLRCAPNLKSLIFQSVFYSDYNSLESESVPNCVSGLESVEFHYLSAEDQEEDVMIWAQYFLKNAVNLKAIKLHIIDERCLEYEAEVYKKLLALPTSSSTCQVEIVGFGRMRRSLSC